MASSFLRGLGMQVPALRRLVEQRDALLTRNAELAAALARLAAEQAALRASLPAHRQETIDAVLGKVRAELPDYRREIIETTLSMTRAEYTVMPRFGFHQPLDYREDSVPEPFGDAVWREGEALPLPAPEDRFGYPADDDTYLRMGATDAAMFKAQIARHAGQLEALAILDFGCSSGRVLRHFETERREQAWRLHGVDIQARAIEWLRLHFPPHYGVATTTVLPHLPFEDNSLDIIYGISVFTHIKYLWDMWLLELRRVLRPGGLLLQTIHTENAWAFYHRNREAEWVRRDHAALIAEAAEMPHDWMHHGDIAVSQAFWKRDIARRNWGRYLEVLDLLPPQHEMSFQDLMVCRKPPA